MLLRAVRVQHLGRRSSTRTPPRGAVEDGAIASLLIIATALIPVGSSTRVR